MATQTQEMISVSAKVGYVPTNQCTAEDKVLLNAGVESEAVRGATIMPCTEAVRKYRATIAKGSQREVEAFCKANGKLVTKTEPAKGKGKAKTKVVDRLLPKKYIGALDERLAEIQKESREQLRRGIGDYSAFQAEVAKLRGSKLSQVEFPPLADYLEQVTVSLTQNGQVADTGSRFKFDRKKSVVANLRIKAKEAKAVGNEEEVYLAECAENEISRLKAELAQALKGAANAHTERKKEEKKPAAKASVVRTRK